MEAEFIRPDKTVLRVPIHMKDALRQQMNVYDALQIFANTINEIIRNTNTSIEFIRVAQDNETERVEAENKRLSVFNQLVDAAILTAVDELESGSAIAAPTDLKAVRVVEQDWTEAQQEQACENIGAFLSKYATYAEDIDIEEFAEEAGEAVGTLVADAVRYTRQRAATDEADTEAMQMARWNIGAASEKRYAALAYTLENIREEWKKVADESDYKIGKWDDLDNYIKEKVPTEGGVGQFVVRTLNLLDGMIGSMATILTATNQTNVADAIQHLADNNGEPETDAVTTNELILAGVLLD